MKKIIGYLRNHIQQESNKLYYSFNGIFLIACISLNYYFDFEDGIIDAYQGREIRILFYFLFYCFAYYFSSFTFAVSFKDNFFYQRQFWFRSLFFLFLISFDAAFYYHRPLVAEHFPVDLQYFIIKCLNNLVSIFTILFPLLIFYFNYEDKKNNFYGVTSKGVDLKPYVILLLLMIPLIALASFDENFLRQYPSLKSNTAADYLSWPKWITVVLFELAYAWDFVSVELIFRGFMVIGMIKVMGKGSILPMVVLYAFYHFGKPPGEAIGSVFGGYILGVIAFYTRSILGGVLIHVGVAWIMDGFAFLQKNFE
jgi:hypothetical protein